MWMNGGLALGVVVAACISEIAKGCWFSRCVLYALLPLALAAAPAVVPASSITSGVAIATCFSPEDLALLLFGDLKGIGTGDALTFRMDRQGQGQSIEGRYMKYGLQDEFDKIHGRVIVVIEDDVRLFADSGG